MTIFILTCFALALFMVPAIILNSQAISANVTAIEAHNAVLNAVARGDHAAYLELAEAADEADRVADRRNERADRYPANRLMAAIDKRIRRWTS